MGEGSGELTLQASLYRTFHVFKPNAEIPLGLTIEPVTPVVIARIIPGGLAEQSELREGDEIVSVNGKHCSSVVDLLVKMLSSKDGSIQIEVRSPGQSSLQMRTASHRSRSVQANGKNQRISEDGSGGSCIDEV